MNTIKIGSQVWATQDLKVSKFRNGESIPLVEDDKEWAEIETAAYCVSPDGYYLYNWYAVNDPRGLAPDGFHVPTDEEWTELTEFLGSDDVADGEYDLKSTDGDGTNSSGFSALLGGCRSFYDGCFSNFGNYGFWWTSSQYFSDHWAWARYLDCENSNVYRNFHKVRNGFSVRCIKTQTT